MIGPEREQRAVLESESSNDYDEIDEERDFSALEDENGLTNTISSISNVNCTYILSSLVAVRQMQKLLRQKSG